MPNTPRLLFMVFEKFYISSASSPRRTISSAYSKSTRLYPGNKSIPRVDFIENIYDEIEHNAKNRDIVKTK